MEDFEINFDYEPMSEEEAMKARFSLMEDGIYDAHIETIKPRVSSTGNSMAEVKASVFDKEGKIHLLTDFLVFTTKMMWKVKHAADSAGLSKEFEEKKFKPQMLQGRTVKVEVKTQIGQEIPIDKLKGKTPGSTYPDKNVINDYVVTDSGAVKHPKAEDDGFGDETIPF